MSGTATIMFKSPEPDKKAVEVEKLISGALLGSSQLLDIQAHDYFGDIVASTQCTVLQMDKAD